MIARDEAHCWTTAVLAFDMGDPEPLADRVRREAVIPAGVREVLSEIVAGARQPKRKAAVKLACGMTARQFASACEFASARQAASRERVKESPDRIGCGNEPSPKPAPLHWPPLAEFDDITHEERRELLREGNKEVLHQLANVWKVEPRTLEGWARDFDKLHAKIFGAPAT
ncbi:MAG: hypothetical protein AB7I68_03940 [Porticoccaceae bacterium]